MGRRRSEGNIFNMYNPLMMHREQEKLPVKFDRTRQQSYNKSLY